MCLLAIGFGDLHEWARHATVSAIDTAAIGRAHFRAASRTDVREDTGVDRHHLRWDIVAGGASDVGLGDVGGRVGHDLTAANACVTRFRRTSP